MGSTAINVPSTPAAPPASPAPVSTPSPVPAAAPSTSAFPTTTYEGIEGMPDLGALTEQLLRGETPGAAPAPAETPSTEPSQVAVPETAATPPVEAAPVAPDAKTQEFEALKGQLSEAQTKLTTFEQEQAALQSKLAQYEQAGPLLEVLSVPGAPKLIQMMAPLLTAGLSTDWDDPRGADIGAQVLNAITAYHPGIASALSNGAAKVHEKELLVATLQRLGMDENSVRDFQAWKNGAKTPAYTLGEYPDINNVGLRDSDGMMMIPLSDGRTVRIDPENADHQLLYQSQKEIFDHKLSIKNREAEIKAADDKRQAEAQAAAHRAQAAAEETRVNEFYGDFGKSQEAAYKALNPAFTGEWALLEQQVQAATMAGLQANPQYAQLVKLGVDAAKHNAPVKAEIADAMARIGKQEIAKHVTFFSDLVKRLTDAEAKVAANGVVLPDNAPTITPQTQVVPGATQTAHPAPTQAAQPQTEEGPPPGVDMLDWLHSRWNQTYNAFQGQAGRR